MDRREFLHHGMLATSLLAAGRLPLLAAETAAGSAIDAKTGPYAVKLVRDYLTDFSPNETAAEKHQRAMRYDIVHWHWGRNGRGSNENTVIGRLRIARQSADDKVVYEVEQKTKIGGVDNVIETEFACNADALDSLRVWRLRRYEIDANRRTNPASELIEKGRCDGGPIRIEGDNYRYEYRAAHPVVTQWHLPFVLARDVGARPNLAFDLLQDLSLFKPDQELVPDGQVEVSVAGGRKVMLQSYAQTGRGVLPVHYLVDAQGRIQLVTGGFLSWALQG
jgi:hypothetical protein